MITFTTADGWTTPASCTWTCDAGFHREDDLCLADVDLTSAWCSIAFPLTIEAELATSTPVYGRLYVPGATEAPGAAAGIRGMLCHSSSAMTTVDVELLTCVDAAYASDVENYDEYAASFAPGSAGTFYYLYGFSGDGGASWMFCDTAGIAGDPVEPGVATIIERPRALFFSEYVEGTSNNKALEITNPTPDRADLSSCTVRLYSNGAATPSASTTLTGRILAAGESLVLCNSLATAAILAVCDVSSSLGVNFNGNDAVELSCGGATLDVIGQIGFDPGLQWGSGDTTTRDMTLRRKCTIVGGDRNGSDAFDPAAEWVAFPVDTFSDLGQHGFCDE
jgi:hypothetical protein